MDLPERKLVYIRFTSVLAVLGGGCVGLAVGAALCLELTQPAWLLAVPVLGIAGAVAGYHAVGWFWCLQRQLRIAIVASSIFLLLVAVTFDLCGVFDRGPHVGDPVTEVLDRWGKPDRDSRTADGDSQLAYTLYYHSTWGVQVVHVKHGKVARFDHWSR